MAGPTLQLRALRYERTEKLKIITLLNRISFLSQNDENSFEFYFKKGKTLGLYLNEQSCPFLLNFSTKKEEYDDLQSLDIITKLKDKPAAFILISAMCNGAQDHKLLANIALEINKIVGGFINLNGAIIPDLKKDQQGNYIQQTQSDYRDFVNSIPGQIHEISYWIDENKRSYSHICDTTWLDNWTLCTDFKLIK